MPFSSDPLSAALPSRYRNVCVTVEVRVNDTTAAGVDVIVVRGAAAAPLASSAVCGVTYHCNKP